MDRFVLRTVELKDPFDLSHKGNQPDIRYEEQDPKYAFCKVKPEHAVGKQLHQVHHAGRQDDEYSHRKDQCQEHRQIDHQIPCALGSEFFIEPGFDAAFFVFFFVAVLQHFC